LVAVNWLAVLVAGILHFAIGMIWYSPIMFGKLWKQLAGVAEMKASAKDMVLSLLGSLVVAYVMAQLVCSNVVCYAGAGSLINGALLGIMVEIGFIATLLLGDMIFEKKPLKLFVLRNGYNLVALAVVGALLAVWR
jgi:hypothetical protein